MKPLGKILVVDDEERLRTSLKTMLESDGFSVETAEDGQVGLDKLLAATYDIAVVDLIMPVKDGMWLINEVSRQEIRTGLVVATGYGTVDLAVNAMKKGAWDFIQKPVDYELLKMVIVRAMEKVTLRREKEAAEKKIRENNRELKAANKKLKELDKLKTDFMSKVVHELRSPLTVISCTLEIIREDLEDENYGEVGTHMDNAISFLKKMVAILNDMLDINTIRSDDIKMEMAEDDLAAIVKWVVFASLPLLDKEKITVETDIPDTPCRHTFSKLRIEQVMINLLANAAKFTPEGGEVKVVLSEDESGVKVSVSDSGLGILEENAHTVFDEFFQIDKKDRRGVGLGLPICKKIVEAHGGTIGVESVVGEGSTFYFFLPENPSI